MVAQEGLKCVDIDDGSGQLDVDVISVVELHSDDDSLIVNQLAVEHVHPAHAARMQRGVTVPSALVVPLLGACDSEDDTPHGARGCGCLEHEVLGALLLRVTGRLVVAHT